MRSRVHLRERRLAAAAFVVATAAAMASCGPAEDHFDFILSLKGGDGSMTCGDEPSCADFSIACGAVVSVRVLDDVDDQVHAERCLAFGGSAGATLCDLNDLGIELGELPAERLRIQIAIWPSDVLEDTAACPSGDLFDLQGLPRSNVGGTYMAFGGQIYFRAGDDAVAEVELSCPDPGQVADCGPPSRTFVVGRVNDLADNLSVSAIDATRLTVSVGEPVARVNPLTQETEWFLEPTDAFTLRREGGSLWQAEILTTFADDACLQVLEDVPQATTALACSIVGEPAAEQLDLTGYLLATPLLDSILTGLGLSAFPANGLVVGKVVDELGNPVAGATVTPSQGTVWYLSSDLTSASTGGVTSSSGYFAASDAPFDTSWEASHSDGRNQRGAYRGGVVVNKATIMVIELDSIGVDE